MIVFKTKGSQVRCIPHGSFGLSQCKSSCKKTCWLTKAKDMNKFPQKIRKYVAFLTGGKSTCEGHAGSDISFENITLCLNQLKLKILFTKEKRTLKTLVLSREANTLPQYKLSCKEQANSDKI